MLDACMLQRLRPGTGLETQRTLFATSSERVLIDELMHVQGHY